MDICIFKKILAGKKSKRKSLRKVDDPKKNPNYFSYDKENMWSDEEVKLNSKKKIAKQKHI